MRTLLLLFALPLCILAQSPDPMTNQRVIQLVQDGMPADELLRMIAAAPAVSFHLSPTDTDQLLRAGVSERTIKAMSARESGLVFLLETPAAGALRPRAEGAERSNVGAPPPDLPARIRIVVVEGEGARSAIRQRAARDPVVVIEDDDHRPIAGAVVVFGLPVSGTSGEFSNGSKSQTMMTDKSGQAVAHGLRANEVPGKLQIYVSASYRALHARTMINQRVEGPAGKVWGPDSQVSSSDRKWKWVVLGVIAAGGAGAGVHFAMHQANSSPLSITPGTVVVGGPR